MHFTPRLKALLITGSCVAAGLVVILLVIFYPTPSKTGAVVSNGQKCASIGSSILTKGGSAVDAAIATLFCEGVSMPQSMGLGGGFLMTIYEKNSGTARSLNAREIAPAIASEDMFHGDSTASQKGPLSIAVPGELIGYWEAHHSYGKLEWKELITPTIELCEEGITVTDYHEGVFKQKEEQLKANPLLKDIFIDPKTNKPLLAGQQYKMMKFAETLKTIAEEGGMAIHNGSLTDKIVEDIKNFGGGITKADFNNYKPEWQIPIKISLPDDLTMYSSPLPGSGGVLGFIFNLLKPEDYINRDNPTAVTNWQRIVESFKFAYGERTKLGDNAADEIVARLTTEEFANTIRKSIKDNTTNNDPSYYGADASLVEDHGTAHISVLAPNGDAVAVTSTINFYFGSGHTSPSTGLIFNNEMDDFSSPNITNGFDLPPSPANFIVPGNRALSSMCPTIIVDKDKNVRMVIGAAGGTKITTSVALVMMKHLWFGADVETAVKDKRIHHQLFPMNIDFEPEYEGDKLVDELRKIGHWTNFTTDGGFAAVTSIARIDSDIQSSYDPRRPGDIEYTY